MPGVWPVPTRCPDRSGAGELIKGERLLTNRLFSYVRYNAALTRQGLDDLGLNDVEPEDVQKLDSIEHIGDLRRIGQAAAQDVTPDHFAGFLGDVQ